MKKILVVLLAVFMLFTKVNVVRAESNDSILDRQYIPNYWSFHYRNGKVWTYGQLNLKHINGKLGYCIEPDSAVNTQTYNSTLDWNKSKYSDEVREKMELYAYYGFGYEGHDDIKYYAAAQHLIWGFSDDERIIWTTEDYSNSTLIDLNPEINKILSLANTHYISPSFSNSVITAKVGENIILNDTNSVLQNKKIITDSEYQVLQNQLQVPIKSRKPITFTFLSGDNKYSNDNTIVYYADIRSQRLASFKKPIDSTSTLTIIPNKIKVVINKKDKETNDMILSDKTAIKIKNIDTNEYVTKDKKEELYFNKEGKISIYLENGNYEIEEIHASNGYYINNEKKKFIIDENTELDNNYEYNIDYYNSKVYGQVNIKKTNKIGENLEGCIFEIYDKNMNLVDTVVTTSEEYDNSKLLSLGKYYVKEVSTLKGYKLDEKIYEFDLEYEDENTNIVKKELEVVNEKINCEIFLLNTDYKGVPIKDVNVSIYNSNNEFVYRGTTNEEGKILISPINYGDYYIVQDKVPNGYLINEEKIKFSINDDSCMSSIKLTNNKVNMPKTSSKNMDIFSIIIFILNIGIFKYVKKNN